MRPLIIHVKDMQADENSGYRAIVDMLDFEKDGWAQVRLDLLKVAQLYESVHDSA